MPCKCDVEARQVTLEEAEKFAEVPHGRDEETIVEVPEVRVVEKIVEVPQIGDGSRY